MAGAMFHEATSFRSAHRRLGHELGDGHGFDVLSSHPGWSIRRHRRLGYELGHVPWGRMFYEATSFRSAHRRLEHELGDEDMEEMLYGATDFNQPIGDWDHQTR